MSTTTAPVGLRPKRRANVDAGVRPRWSPRAAVRSVARAASLAALMAIVSSCASTGAAPWVCPTSRFRSPKPLVIAHASGAYFGPPNTVAMMRAAVKAGADMVDADVRVTADGALVAAHDDDLRAMTGTTGSLRTKTLAELQTLDAAHTWSGPNHDYPLRGHGVTIATVEDILNAFPHRRVSLELKTTGGEQSLCRLLRRLHRTTDVYVGSAGDAAAETFSAICPEVAITVTDAVFATMRTVRATGTPWCSPSPVAQPPFAAGGRTLTAETVRWDHEHGMAVFTWTLDDPRTLTAAAAAGVDGVFTGRPDIARAIFDSQVSRNRALRT